MRRKLRWIVVGAVVAVVLGLAGGYAVFSFQGGDPPAPPALPRLAHGTAKLDGHGRWQAARGRGMFAGYRVREHYLGVGARTAVGRTPAVTGTIQVAGDRVTGARLRADLRQLRSDQPGRDSALRGRAIETDRYPTASFVLREPFAVKTAPQRASGTLQLHGRRAPFELFVAGQARNARRLELVGVGRVDFARFGVKPPSVAGLVRVENHGLLEFRLVFEPAR